MAARRSFFKPLMARLVGCAVAICALLSGDRAIGEPTIIVLDASASMARDFGGETRLSVAKSAVRDVIDIIHREDPEHDLGFVTFYEGCWVRVMAQPAPLAHQRESLLGYVDGLHTTEFGHTPIARSLEIAANLLYGSGGNIVLVSDGQESCDEGRDLCKLAAFLKQKQVALEVNLVGLALSQSQRDVLKCIPEETGGVFIPVENREGFIEALGFATQTSAGARAASCIDNRGGLLARWCETE